MVAAGPDAARGRTRTSCWSCSTTSASRSSAATAPTSTRRTSTRSPPAACASPTSTPPRCARRRAPACSPGATTTRTAWAASPTSPSGYPGYWGRIPRENGFLSEILARARLRRRTRWASGTSRPRTRRTWPRHASSWPLGRGFERWYGFHGGETHQFVPDAVPGQPLGAAAAHARRRLPPQRGPRRPRHRATSATCARSTATSRSSSTSRPARATRRTTRRPSGSSATAGSSTTGWDALARARRFARQLRAGPAARRHRAVAAAAVGAGVGRRSSRGPDASPARFMECFAGVPLAHRRRRSAACSTSSSELGELDDTLVVLVSDNGASAEGGAHGSINDARAVERRPRRARASCAPASTSSAGRPRTTTTRGAGRWPATRRSGAGSARCTRAASPIRASCSWPRGIAATRRAIRHQFAHAIDVLPTMLELVGVERARRDRRASRRRRSRARASRTCSTTRRRARAAHDAVLRDARQPRRSTTTAGRR